MTKTLRVAVRPRTELTPEDVTQLQKLRIDAHILKQANLLRLNDSAARELGFNLGKPGADDLGGLYFPYLDADGNTVNGRIRRDNHGEDAKYVSLPKSKGIRTLYALPEDWRRWEKYQKLEGLLVEAEKSQLAVSSWASRMKHPLVAFAMGGRDGWRGLDLSLFAGRRVGVMLDANVWNRAKPEIEQSELALVAELRTKYKADAFIWRLPQKPIRGVNGPDDYLGIHKDVEFGALLKTSVEPWLMGLGASWQEWQDAQPPQFIIKDFLQDLATTLIAGLSGDGKTWMLINMVWSLLTGNKLFNYFPVLAKSKQVIYLSPENGLGAIKYRMEKFGLGKFVQSGQLIVRSLEYPRLPLTDPKLILAARGADVFLDTIVRFMSGDENSNSDNSKGLADAIFNVLGAGARCLVGAAHSPKGFAEAEYMTLENAVRGGGDIGAMLGTCWGVKLDTAANTTRVYVRNLKPRDMEPVPAFIVVGRPHIDAGRGFQMETPPGQVTPDSFALSKKKQQKVGRKKDDAKVERTTLIGQIRDKPFTEIKEAVVKGGWTIADSTLKRELSQIRSAAKLKVNVSKPERF